MFNIFKKIKYIIMKKDELDQQLKDAISVAQKLGAENKILKTENDVLKTDNAKLKDEFKQQYDYATDLIKSYYTELEQLKELESSEQRRINDTIQLISNTKDYDDPSTIT